MLRKSTEPGIPGPFPPTSLSTEVTATPWSLELARKIITTPLGQKAVGGPMYRANAADLHAVRWLVDVSACDSSPIGVNHYSQPDTTYDLPYDNSRWEKPKWTGYEMPADPLEQEMAANRERKLTESQRDVAVLATSISVSYDEGSTNIIQVEDDTWRQGEIQKAS